MSDGDINAGCNDGVCTPRGRKNLTNAPGAPGAPDNSVPTLKQDENLIKIDIISDTMCPWCWVGKRGLEAALKQSPEVNVEVNWLPYFLDKSLPEEGKPVWQYYLGNYGDPLAGERMKPGLINAGKRCGIDFETHYVNMMHYRPTIRSHRLIQYAKRQQNNKQDEMVEQLFHMYYEEGKHLNSIEHLVEAATKVGLEGDIKGYLESDEDEKEVYDEAEKVKPRAQGVPTFLFTKPGTNFHHTFSGGQPSIAFQKVFNKFSAGDDEK
jgi:predicted DsbA family dithiol-disulfide isomerase